MTAATIQPLRDGRAVLDDGVTTQPYPNWRAAAVEADARRLSWLLLPFPTCTPGQAPAARTPGGP